MTAGLQKGGNFFKWSRKPSRLADRLAYDETTYLDGLKRRRFDFAQGPEPVVGRLTARSQTRTHPRPSRLSLLVNNFTQNA